MATTMYFEEQITDQGGKTLMMVEIGRSSYFSEDSIYHNIDEKLVIMDLATAKKFGDAVISVGSFHGLVD
jgi:hypothetical protein